MKTRVRTILPLLAGILLASTSTFAIEAEPTSKPLPTPGKDGVISVEWEDLIPADFDPERIYTELNVDALDDGDPRAADAMAKLRAAWDAAPTVAALDGKRVRVPGFVVPLEGDGRKLSRFLLVPYIGACIHVPPPPANQMVLVQVTGELPAARGLYDPVWVTGLLHTERSRSELGQSGYRIDASRVDPYVEEKPPY